MILKDLLRGVPVLTVEGDEAAEIRGLAYSSKDVKPGFLFAALKGAQTDGFAFAAEAAANGAAAVLSDRPRPDGVAAAWIRVFDPREALALCSANFYGQPSHRMKVVGITGTKGKTTTTFILEAILKTAGARVGVIGTITHRGPDFEFEAKRTTPEAPDLQRMLRDMLDQGATHCLMEVSSHSLEQKRVWGMSFDVAVFTNLSGEHLDYHQSMENYFEAKRKLFYLNHKRSASVVNMDDPWGQKLIAELPMKTITFGLEPAAIVRALRFNLTDDGMELHIAYPGNVMRVQSHLVGKHNVYNILAAVGAGLALNISPQDIAAGIAALKGVPGRFEKVENARGFNIVVDYAHTDSALEHLLATAREFKPRRIILVFGAGGNRDTTKRERMGRVAARLSDWSVLTSDNPRNEDPLEIIKAIEQGFDKEASKAYEIIPDRREAITRALAMANKGDFVLVAGKGHEDYQIFKDRTIHFSDMEVIHEILKTMEAA